MREKERWIETEREGSRDRERERDKKRVIRGKYKMFNI